MRAQRPIIHGRDHERGGADTVRIAYESVGGDAVAGGVLPRARIWSTYARAPFTVSDSTAYIYPFNHGVTTDADVYSIHSRSGSTPDALDFATVRILQGGFYAITYRFIADGFSGGGTWDGTRLAVNLYDVAPDYWDGWHDDLSYAGFGGVRSYVTTILDDEAYLPTDVYCEVYVPDGFPDLTFGDAGHVSDDPETNTGSYIEVVRLGDYSTVADWVDWWFETPPGEALPS